MVGWQWSGEMVDIGVPGVEIRRLESNAGGRYEEYHEVVRDGEFHGCLVRERDREAWGYIRPLGGTSGQSFPTMKAALMVMLVERPRG